MHQARVVELLNQIKSPHVLVVGDIMIDRTVYGSMKRIAKEAPTPVFDEEYREDTLGGAAAVANVLAGLGCTVTLLGLVGEDAEAYLLRRKLRGVGEHLSDGQKEPGGVIAACLVTDSVRPTTVKTRYVADGVQVFRSDLETRWAPEAMVLREVDSVVQGRAFDAIVISDYGKGVCTRRVIEAIWKHRRKAQVIYDPAVLSKEDDFLCHSLITNRTKAAQFLGSGIHDYYEGETAAKRLAEETNVGHVVLTMDSLGMALCSAYENTHHVYPHARGHVVDPSGAGDTVSAVLAACLASGISHGDAIHLCNRAAGVQVTRRGVSRITRADISGTKLANFYTLTTDVPLVTDVTHNLTFLLRDLRDNGKRIVFTNGCFDVLHPGHVAHLREAKSFGDVLVVGLNSDESVKRIKGNARPVNPLRTRVAMLEALDSVDYVVVFDEDTPEALIRAVKPDVLCKGGDYPGTQIVGSDFVLYCGGEVRLTEKVEAQSTTEFLARIK